MGISLDAKKGSGALAVDSEAFPPIAAGGQQALTYFAKVSGDAANEKDTQAASVIFTVSIVG